MYPKREFGFSDNSFNITPAQTTRFSIDEVVDSSKEIWKGRCVMKLSLFFLLMDLLTGLAYPIIFVWRKLHRLSNFDERKTLHAR